MVLELITNTLKLRHKPYLMFFEAILLTIISIFFSISIFPGRYASIAILAFLTIGAIPLFNKLYSYDSYITNYKKHFFQRHKQIFILLFFFFLGILFTFVTSYFVLNENTSQHLFTAQFEELEKIAEIRNTITGNLTINELNDSKFRSVFGLIFKNNFLVVLAAIILSFFYGAGGLFLIAWNASLLAVVIINYISSAVYGVGAAASLIGAKHGFLVFLGFVPHGFFEILAYFIASVAGAMFARDLFKDIFSTPFKWHAIRDFLYLFVFAIICLVIGALIEASYFV
jgi:uncharacterized membrane protein SpoIIM required for sporulation